MIGAISARLTLPAAILMFRRSQSKTSTARLRPSEGVERPEREPR